MKYNIKPLEFSSGSLKIISLGLGVQSTALYFMSSLGVLPRCDYAIFSDTGGEKQKTMEYLKFLLLWSTENNGIPIIHLTERNLYKSLVGDSNFPTRLFSAIPAYTANSDGSTGMLRRQCTAEFKVIPIDLKIRELYKAKSHQRLPLTEIWKGISVDELERMSKPEERWKKFVYPFCGYTATRDTVSQVSDPPIMSRAAISNWYNKNGLPLPPKSSCTFCPFQSQMSWKYMKENEPVDFKQAVNVDYAIRNQSAKGTISPLFLLEDKIPLAEFSFKSNQLDMFESNCSSDCNV